MISDGHINLVVHKIYTEGVNFTNFCHHRSELKICHNGLVVVMNFRYHFSILFTTYIVWDYKSYKQSSPWYFPLLVMNMLYILLTVCTLVILKLLTSIKSMCNIMGQYKCWQLISLFWYRLGWKIYIYIYISNQPLWPHSILNIGGGGVPYP